MISMEDNGQYPTVRLEYDLDSEVDFRKFMDGAIAELERILRDGPEEAAVAGLEFWTVAPLQDITDG